MTASRRLAWGALLLSAVAESCAGSGDDGICGSITARPDGIHLSDCAEGQVVLKDIRYDTTGAKLAFGFVATCGGKSARGTWSRGGALECVDGANDPCKEGGVCTPTSDADCRIIANCREWGDCGYRDGKCVPTEEGCAQSDVSCGLSGACHLGDNGACTVVSDTDCQAPFGNCPTCPFKGACTTFGNCTAASGRCIAGSNADCQKSTQCAFSGQCTFQGATCIAATNADCARAEVCRTAGQCTAIGGVCSAR